MNLLPLKILDTGIITIEFQQLKTINFFHLYSSLQIEDYSSVIESITTIVGYTEWVSKTEPVISLSWDWELCRTNNKLEYAMQSLPFSNTQIIDNTGKPYKQNIHDQLLKKLITNLHWQNTVDKFIKQNNHY